jgi:hypothetical protein
MLKKMFIGLLCLSSFTASARRNSTHVGFLIGTTGIYKTHDVSHHRTTGNDDNLALSFTGDINFDKAGKRFYLSIPMRLHTIRFDVSETYYTTTTPYIIYSGGKVTAASLGAGLGLNYVPFGNHDIAMLTNLSLVPLAEAGDFMGGLRINGVAELYAGLRIFDRVMMGARVTRFVREYSVNRFVVPNPNGYSIMNLMFDLRFNISAKKTTVNQPL